MMLCLYPFQGRSAFVKGDVIEAFYGDLKPGIALCFPECKEKSQSALVKITQQRWASTVLITSCQWRTLLMILGAVGSRYRRLMDCARNGNTQFGFVWPL